MNKYRLKVISQKNGNVTLLRQFSGKAKEVNNLFYNYSMSNKENLNKYFNILNNRIINSFTSYENIILIKYKINCYGDHDDKNQFNNIKIITR